MPSFLPSISDFVGDSGAGGTNGLVVAPAAGDSGKFLKGNATWASPTFNSSYVSKTGSYTLVTGTDNYVSWDTSGGVGTATLPTAVGASGQQFVIAIKTGTNILTVNTTGAQTIGPAASGQIKMAIKGDSITVVSDGANWLLTGYQVSVSSRATGDTDTIANNTAAQTVNPTVTYNPLGDYSGVTGKYTVSMPGKYEVQAMLQWSAVGWTANEITELYLYKNGAPYSVLCRKVFEASINNVEQIYGSDNIQCVNGDTIEIWTLQQSGGNLAINAVSNFSVTRIGM